MITRIRQHKWATASFAVLFLGGGTLFAINSQNQNPYISDTVTRGDVIQTVTVSGVTEAPQTADLSFSTTGVITDLYVTEGSMVEEGQILATLANQSARAAYDEAQAAYDSAVAQKNLLLAGASDTTRAVSEQAVTNAQSALDTTIAEQKALVAAARATLLSADLEARAADDNETALPPTIGGTYSCTESGEYIIEPYRSGADSGYSFRVNGLERGTHAANAATAITFGDCGLTIRFHADQPYTNTTWAVAVPNTAGASYARNRTAYEVAQAREEMAISAARNALALAQGQSTDTQADAQPAAIQNADAALSAARARIAQASARVADFSIAAPFAGIVTDVDAVVGETATNASITVTTQEAFVVTARIPEIDITTVTENDSVTMSFDARPNEIVHGVIDFLSPLPEVVDGVAYFPARIVIQDAPTWLRSGLHADVAIIIAKQNNTLRIPSQFIHNDTVLLPPQDKPQESTVRSLLVGTDGFTAIDGLSEGDVVLRK